MKEVPEARALPYFQFRSKKIQEQFIEMGVPSRVNGRYSYTDQSQEITAKSFQGSISRPGGKFERDVGKWKKREHAEKESRRALAARHSRHLPEDDKIVEYPVATPPAITAVPRQQTLQEQIDALTKEVTEAVRASRNVCTQVPSQATSLPKLRLKNLLTYIKETRNGGARQCND